MALHILITVNLRTGEKTIAQNRHGNPYIYTASQIDREVETLNAKPLKHIKFEAGEYRE